MTTTARRIPAAPVNTGQDTWTLICDLLVDGSSVSAADARATLVAATPVAAMLISEEHTATDPIIVSGVGPQVRIYTLHGEDAMEADHVPVLPLAHDPTDGAWSLSLPASGPDYEIARTLLGAGQVSVRDVAETTATEMATSTAKADEPPRSLTIDLSRLEARP